MTGGLEVRNLRSLSWFGHQKCVTRPLQLLEPQLVYPQFGATTSLLNEQALQLLGRADAEGMLLSAVTSRAGFISACQHRGISHPDSTYSSAVSRNLLERRQLALCEAWKAPLVGPIPPTSAR